MNGACAVSHSLLPQRLISPERIERIKEARTVNEAIHMGFLDHVKDFFCGSAKRDACECLFYLYQCQKAVASAPNGEEASVDMGLKCASALMKLQSLMQPEMRSKLHINVTDYFGSILLQANIDPVDDNSVSLLSNFRIAFATANDVKKDVTQCEVSACCDVFEPAPHLCAEAKLKRVKLISEKEGGYRVAGLRRGAPFVGLRFLNKRQLKLMARSPSNFQVMVEWRLKALTQLKEYVRQLEGYQNLSKKEREAEFRWVTSIVIHLKKSTDEMYKQFAKGIDASKTLARPEIGCRASAFSSHILINSRLSR
ncbi:MAG: hypothetical protein ACPGUD_06015 [Parashewanella sp.]